MPSAAGSASSRTGIAAVVDVVDADAVKRDASGLAGKEAPWTGRRVKNVKLRLLRMTGLTGSGSVKVLIDCA
jgi:hypothetical protein